MTLTRNVNGVDVVLGPVEQAAVQTDWSNNQPAPPTALQIADQKKANGIAITSTSNSQLNSTYAIDSTAVVKMNSTTTYINTNNRLPGGAAIMQYPDIKGTLRPFTTTAQFLGFASASADLIQKIDIGQSPPQSATIP